MAINRGPGGSGDASNAASNASAIATVKAQEAAESAASALSSANNAALSASSASASASSASTSASEASGSATTASSASSTATTQADIATTKASEASTSAANALTSETNAATSADLAEDWAIKTSGPVSGSEYSSKYHAGLASASATSANNAKTAAEAARDQTLAVYDSFDDRYLGTKASDPTVDNDGDPLVAGSLYFNSVSGVMRLYTGSAWVAAYVSGTASSVAVTPAGNIAATNVQTALQELDSEKLPVANPSYTGTLTGSSDVVNIGSGQVYKDASGNVGIGTSSPSVKLDVNGTVDATNLTRGGSQVYSRNNILGTVSQSSGVPTGAIIERGSNANGEFVKYADGTLICTIDVTFTSVDMTTAAMGGFRSAGQSFTLPVNFSVAPVITALSNSANLQAIAGWSNHSPTAPTLFLWRASSSTQTQRVAITAIGRWY
jgi:hypothetical protein